MELVKFGLGIRFTALGGQSEQSFARKAYESIFSVLTLSELEDLNIYGGQDSLARETDPESGRDVFLAVINGGSLKQMRKVFAAIDSDAAIGMYLSHSHPYVENNRLSRAEGLSFYGRVQKDGTISGGDGTLDGLTVPKAHGKRSPVGKGIKVLLAPEAFDDMSSTEAIMRLTLAARKHFQGVKLVPLPISHGGRGLTHALITACEGALRRAEITGDTGEKIRVGYGVLRGRIGVIEASRPENAEERGVSSSFGLGEIIRRALDEGLCEILTGVDERNFIDGGAGLARALGIKLYDRDGNELKGGAEILPLIDSADAEFLMPRLSGTRFIVVDASDPNEALLNGADNFAAALSKALGRDVDPASGFAGVLAALTNAQLTRGIDAILDAVDFTRLVKGVALVVSGAKTLGESTLSEGEVITSIAARCEKLRIPVAVIAETVSPGALTTLGDIGLVKLDPGSASDLPARFDEAADRMFRLIRIGRDVEKIGAPKQPKAINYWRLRLKSYAMRRLSREPGDGKTK